MPKKRFKSIKIEEKSYDYLNFIADRLNQKKSVFLRRLLDELFDLFSEYRKGSCNIFFDSTRGQLILTVVGSSYIECGIRQAETAEQENKAEPVIVKLPSKETKLEGELNG